MHSHLQLEAPAGPPWPSSALASLCSPSSACAATVFPACAGSSRTACGTPCALGWCACASQVLCGCWRLLPLLSRGGCGGRGRGWGGRGGSARGGDGGGGCRGWLQRGRLGGGGWERVQVGLHHAWVNVLLGLPARIIIAHPAQLEPTSLAVALVAEDGLDLVLLLVL